MKETDDNPYRSPEVLEQQEHGTPEHRQADKNLPGLVAFMFLLFIAVATIHFVACGYDGNPLQGVLALTSGCVGFAILFPSTVTWLLGMSYSCLMAVIMFGASAATYVDRPILAALSLPALVIYLAIMGLLVHLSRDYYLRWMRKTEKE